MKQATVYSPRCNKVESYSNLEESVRPRDLRYTTEMTQIYNSWEAKGRPEFNLQYQPKEYSSNLMNPVIHDNANFIENEIQNRGFYAVPPNYPETVFEECLTQEGYVEYIQPRSQPSQNYLPEDYYFSSCQPNSSTNIPQAAVPSCDQTYLPTGECWNVGVEYLSDDVPEDQVAFDIQFACELCPVEPTQEYTPHFVLGGDYLSAEPYGTHHHHQKHMRENFKRQYPHGVHNKTPAKRRSNKRYVNSKWPLKIKVDPKALKIAKSAHINRAYDTAFRPIFYNKNRVS